MNEQSAPDVVDTVDDLTTEWLTGALRWLGYDTTVRSLECTPIGEGQMGASYRLRYELEPDDAAVPSHTGGEARGAGPRVPRRGHAGVPRRGHVLSRGRRHRLGEGAALPPRTHHRRRDGLHAAPGRPRAGRARRPGRGSAAGTDPGCRGEPRGVARAPLGRPRPRRGAVGDAHHGGGGELRRRADRRCDPGAARARRRSCRCRRSSDSRGERGSDPGVPHPLAEAPHGLAR